MLCPCVATVSFNCGQYQLLYTLCGLKVHVCEAGGHPANHMLLGSPTPSRSRDFKNVYRSGSALCVGSPPAIFPRVPHARSASFPSGARAATRIVFGYIDTVRIGILYTAYGVEHTAHRRSPSQSPRGAQVRRKYNSIEMYGLLSSFLSTPRRGSRNTPGEPDIHAHMSHVHVHVCMSRCGDGRWRDTQAHIISLELDRPIEGDTANATRAQPGTPGRAHATTICRCVLCTLCSESDCGKWYKNRMMRCTRRVSYINHHYGPPEHTCNTRCNTCNAGGTQTL